jgi:hypothetical protein
MIFAIPGIIEPMPPALQPGEATPEAAGAQAVACDAGAAASSSNGTATQPPRLADKATRTATARDELKDRDVAGMR